ncbi:MAG TPA: acetamidase/formamidase family protein [Mycobacteriales bacterium]
MTEHLIEPTLETAHDVFSRDRKPILTIDPGDTVVVRTLDAHGNLERNSATGAPPERLLPEARGHCLCGPIAVRGAEPGMHLAVHLADIRPGEWGWTVAGRRDNWLNRRLRLTPDDAAMLTWDLDPDARVGTSHLGHVVDLNPFLGVVGLPPAEPGEHSTTPPRPCGGNIDCKDLVAGSTLFLPVTVPDALLSVGDGHAAQGDGEVSGTAIECPMTTELGVDLVTDAALPVIHATTPTSRITFGFDENLNEAMALALDAMVTWLERSTDLSRPQALALASVVVDLRVTQVANEVWGVHAVLADDAIRTP